jgi:hypothetical protein
VVVRLALARFAPKALMPVGVLLAWGNLGSIEGTRKALLSIGTRLTTPPFKNLKDTNAAGRHMSRVL